jgi:hypothetical protein
MAKLEFECQPHPTEEATWLCDARAALMDDARNHSSWSDALKLSVAASVVQPMFALDAAPAAAGFRERFSTNFIEASKTGMSNMSRGYLSVTGGALANSVIDTALSGLSGKSFAPSRNMYMLDTLSLAAAGAASMRFPVLKAIGAATAVHSAMRMYELFE